MKQKKLMALMLAAAMAVTSITLPGGVLEPETVYADVQASDITFGTYDSTTGTLTATVPAGTAQSNVKYSISGGGYGSWRSDGVTVDAEGDVSIQLPAGNYAPYIQLIDASDSEKYACKQYSTVKVGYDAATDIASGTLQVLVNGETVLENNKKFNYTGSPVINSVKVVKQSETAELVEGSEAVYTYTFRDSKGIMYRSTPTDEGTYTLTIRPRTFRGSLVNHTGYGEYTFTFTIAKKQLEEEEVTKIVKFEAPTITYNGEDQSKTVKDAVKLSDNTDGLNIEEITFEKNSETVTSLKDAGTYSVKVKVSNDKSSGTATVGQVTIGQYQTKVEDFKITANETTYNDKAQAATVVPNNELLSKENITVTYKKVENKQVTETTVENPTDAGTYRVFVAYKGDANCAALAATDTNIDLVINKKAVSPVIDVQTVKTDTSGSTIVDLSSVTEKYGSIIADKVKITTGAGIKTATYDNGKITFELDDAGKVATTAMETAITLDLSDALENYTATITIPITIVPADTQIATITLKDAEFTYDGEAKALKYTVTDKYNTKAENVTSGALNLKLGVTMTETITKNGEKVKEIKDAGTYVVAAEYKYEDGKDKSYGKLVKEVTVNPAAMDDATKYFKLGESNLTYDGKSNFISEICELVTVSGAGIEKKDYDIDLVGSDVVDGVRNAGDVTVKVKMLGGNYTTADWLELGKVTIAKATPGALTVTDDGKGNLTVKIGNKEFSENDLNIEYFAKGNETKLTAKPTKAGEYTAKISVKDATNFEGDAKEYAYKISSSSSSSSGSSSSSSDASKETAKSETTASGTTVTSTEEKHDDGSATIKEELKNEETGVEATVTVEKDASGNVTEAAAEVTEKSSDNKTTISAATVADIKEAAGTDDVKITTKTVDANGDVVREVSVKASDLTAGKKLKVVAVDKKTGEKTLVNATTYKVAEDGSLSLNNLGNASYEVVDTATAKALTDDVLKTVKVVKEKATVTAGKKTTIKLSKKLNMDNVKKITYTSAKKSVATVSKNGKITAKSTGNATIKAKVVLNNGKTKTVSMKVKVKAKVKIKK